MENTIAITEKLFMVEVPKDAKYFMKHEGLHGFNIVFESEIQNPLNVGGDIIKASDVNFKIIGLIQCPELLFDFEVDESWVTDNNTFGYPNYLYSNKNEVDFLCPTERESFRTRIHKAIQDSGRLLINPYGEKYIVSKPCRITVDQCAYGDDYCECKKEMQWQEAESKVIKGNLILIEKI